MFGRGAGTEYSNPEPTLEALEAFRFTAYAKTEKRLGKAVEFLLWHWEVKKPIGPCQYGMGTLFRKIEFPFLRYNLFHYCYTLSFYNKAIKDSRFKEAICMLKDKVINGKMIIENPNKKLNEMEFCRKGQPSDIATLKYGEIIDNIEK
jgi:hypothetical protein